MTVKVTFPNGEIQIIPKAVKVDSTNYHEGMHDFYSEDGALVEQISLDHKITWEVIDEIDPSEEETLEDMEIPLFLRDDSGAPEENERDLKDSSAEE